MYDQQTPSALETASNRRSCRLPIGSILSFIRTGFEWTTRQSSASRQMCCRVVFHLPFRFGMNGRQKCKPVSYENLFFCSIIKWKKLKMKNYFTLFVATATATVIVI
jgi:hypothetical protein